MHARSTGTKPCSGAEFGFKMRTLAIVTGLFLIATCFQDIFEAVLLPRRIDREWRFMYFFYRFGWSFWSAIASRFGAGRRRESIIAIFGPLSMVLLFIMWGLSLVVGFGLIQWGLSVGSGLGTPLIRQFDLSADAFFTLGIENLATRAQISLILIFVEAGTGFGFIALMVSYLPVLYQHFSQRDARLVQLDARAGTPATAGTVLRRYVELGSPSELVLWLAEWEHWAADLVETHSAYPMLAFYRSQHENQSWLATLGVLLDLTAFLLVSGDDLLLIPASGTFLSARRVLKEICISLGVDPLKRKTVGTRSTASDRASLVQLMDSASWKYDKPSVDENALNDLVASYEPMLQALSRYLLLPLPTLLPSSEQVDEKHTDDARTRLLKRVLEDAVGSNQRDR